MKAAGLIDGVYWDTDVSAPFVLAERLRGHGPVFIQHFASWTVLWALLATRNLPHHAQLWEAVGYPFSVASALVLGLATGRIAGRWAGVTAAATALVVGPFALRSELTVIYHVIPLFTSAVLAAYLVTLERQWSRPRPGPSFLIVDPTTPFMSSAPSFTPDATERHTFGPLQVYLFKTDISDRIHAP